MVGGKVFPSCCDRLSTRYQDIDTANYNDILPS